MMRRRQGLGASNSQDGRVCISLVRLQSYLYVCNLILRDLLHPRSKEFMIGKYVKSNQVTALFPTNPRYQHAAQDATADLLSLFSGGHTSIFSRGSQANSSDACPSPRTPSWDDIHRSNPPRETQNASLPALPSTTCWEASPDCASPVRVQRKNTVSTPISLSPRVSGLRSSGVQVITKPSSPVSFTSSAPSSIAFHTLRWTFFRSYFVEDLG
jgi:hypothetical protein